MKRVVVINPLLSGQATGMGLAAEGLGAVLPPGSRQPAPRLDRWFCRVNRLRPAFLRQVFRLALAQIAPWFTRREDFLLFSSHHAPLWRTGRHAVILYDLIALHFPSQSRTQTLYYRFVLPRVVRCATRVVTISDTVRAELAGQFPGTAAAQATVIPAYVSRLGRPAPAGVSLAERRRRGVLAFVGARYRHKNLSFALAALKQAPGAGLSLVVAGCRRELWPELGRLEAAGRARTLGYADDAALDELYGTSLALLYPSLAEGQGLPPLEAMAAGCPVICADIPVLHETCGDAAFYVDPRDPAALAGLLAGLQSGAADAEIEQRIAAGRRRVEAFRQPALAARWRAFLEGMA